MAWARLDDGFHSHPKVMDAGNEAAGVFVRALTYCSHFGTDGFVPLSWAGSIADPKALKRVTEARLWRTVDAGDRLSVVDQDGDEIEIVVPSPGFYIDDFLEFNPAAAKVKRDRDELRRVRSEAGRKGAEKRWGTRPADSKTDGKADGTSHGKPHGKPMAAEWQPDGKAMAPGVDGKPIAPTRPDPSRVGQGFSIDPSLARTTQDPAHTNGASTRPPEGETAREEDLDLDLDPEPATNRTRTPAAARTGAKAR
jgi:hypothetical protein